jgi:hypothetical protein
MKQKNLFRNNNFEKMISYHIYSKNKINCHCNTYESKQFFILKILATKKRKD